MAFSYYRIQGQLAPLHKSAFPGERYTVSAKRLDARESPLLRLHLQQSLRIVKNF